MKVAVIGSGRMGRRHIQVVQELGLTLVGICDSNPAVLAPYRPDQSRSPVRESAHRVWTLRGGDALRALSGSFSVPEELWDDVFEGVRGFENVRPKKTVL